MKQRIRKDWLFSYIVFFSLIENDNSTSIKKWSDTRWDSRWSSIDSLIQNYKALIISLQELEDEGNERSVDARGLSLAIKSTSICCVIVYCSQDIWNH